MASEEISKSTEMVVVESGDWVTKLVPAGTQLSFGAATGLAAGYAMRQGGKIAGALLGTGFIFIQALAYKGYIEVDWQKIEREYYNLLDHDKDGKVTAKDFEMMFESGSDFLKFNLPAGSGFTAGLTYGLGGSLTTVVGATVAYGGASSLIMGQLPTDLFSSPVLPQNFDQVMASAGNYLQRKRSLEETLHGCTIEELRQLEWEVKNDITVSAELMGVNMKAQPTSELLYQIEDAKKFVKAH